MVKFDAKGSDLYIDNQKVIKGYESFNGWYWFATEVARRQDSSLPNGRQVKNDIIYYGFVQGQEEEWGYFSKAKLESLKPKVWTIPKKNLLYSGRRKK